jgi:Zn-dependent peptidase ImmA (M78 family)
LVARRGDEIVIGVNESQADVRQRFTIAHEIGHMLLHADQPLIVDHGFALIGLRRDDGAPGDQREIEANAFAAALLMPEKWVTAALRGRDVDLSDDAEIQSLAKRFGVSQQAMMYRLMNLGLLKNL